MSNLGEFRIPYSKPYFPPGTRDDLLEAFDKTAISGSGFFVNEVEKIIAQQLRIRESIAVTNGSAAIRLAYQMAELRPGARVVLPGWGFHVAANVAYSMGAEIEFRDVESDSWCMALDSNLDLLDEDQKIIIVLIHTLGNFGRMSNQEAFKKHENLFLIEDAAEALYSKSNENFLGTNFNVGTFSFHAAKTLTSGEGGMVVTGNQKLALLGKLIRNQGMKSERPYFHEVPGDNFRLSNLLAAILLKQMENSPEIIKRRNHVYNRYVDELNNFPKNSFILPTDSRGFFPWGFGFRIPEQSKISVHELRESLKAKGIDSRPGFTSASELPYYSSINKGLKSQLINSDLLAKSVILLPHFPDITDSEISEICEIIKIRLN